MIDEIRNISSDKKELKKFGFTMGVVLAILGGLLWWRGRGSFPIFFGISLFFFVSGLLWPIVLKPIHKAWMTLAHILGWIMTRVILSVLFFILFTPIGWIAGLFGKRFLEVKFDPKIRSYWILKDPGEVNPKEAYEKQF